MKCENSLKMFKISVFSEQLAVPVTDFPAQASVLPGRSVKLAGFVKQVS